LFQDEKLKEYLDNSEVIRTQSAVIAEWNMNIPNNILKVGNYRYRPLAIDSDPDSKYRLPSLTFDINDIGNFYTNATDADVKIDGGISPEDNSTPMFLISKKEKQKLLYSLEDCFNRFRPRSGINKATFISGKYFHHSNPSMFNRPRYYMSDKNDLFKYWTSYRTEDGLEYGISNFNLNGNSYISDASPFVVYKEKVPANRIIVKMQTHIGDTNLGTFTSLGKTFSDPFYQNENKSTPKKWKIQYLDSNNNWVDIINFNNSSVRNDGTPIIKSDGYVELAYGLIIPEKYKNIFIKADEFSSETLLPEKSINGYAYLIKNSETSLGEYHIWTGSLYEKFTPTYGWYLQEETIDRLTNFVTDTTSPISYVNTQDGLTKYREFSYIYGLRIVVDTMTKINSTFDLIELSPRLCVDLSEKTINFALNKIGSDIGISGLPVGQLLASTGSLTLFDYDQAFNTNNLNSIIKDFITKNIQIKFYEIITDEEQSSYFIPIKTMYTEGFPATDNRSRTVSIQLRDMFFYLESLIAPQILLTNVSVSSAISMLLDSIGFSNYIFKRINFEKESIIPFFFIPPDKTVAEILNDLARSTQTAMFFDEYNNFVCMSKNYIMPTTDQRNTDIVFYGSKDIEKDGVVKNKTISSNISNIVGIASQNTEVFNDGLIKYKTKYIQKTYGSIRQASLIDKEKTWIYKPSLLWEVEGTENTKSINDSSGRQSDYILSAIPLNSDLNNLVPSVSNHKIINNTMDLGEGVYWITRYNGYFYANGEVIKYDAVQYSITDYGNVWITSTQDYQNYFSKLRHNGKIYPTGLIRIYAKPFYENINEITRLKNGDVEKHGRAQFGTSITFHNAGINQYWSNNLNVRGCSMKSDLLFSLSSTEDLQSQSLSMPVDNLAAGVSNELAKQSIRSGTIKNFLTLSYKDEVTSNSILSTQSGTIQSSALVISGPSFTTTQNGIDFISYVNKPLDDRFKHFGTRMRIVGKIENNENRGQTPIGSTTYFVVTGNTPDQNINISGGSGGMAVMINPSTNVGYYFEILALTENNINNYNTSAENLHNVIFYKIKRSASDVSGTTIKQGDAIPIKLWGGLSNIIVDDGNFTGQYRMVGEENPTVYDLAVEYQNIGTIRRFYLYINNKIIAIVDDKDPLPIYNNMALFVRGSARCMFENIYALTNNYSQNTVFALDTPVMTAINDSEIDANESFRKYSMSGIVQSTYLSGIDPNNTPKYNIYFEEFGTIMREAAYFNIRYDKAYPALYAIISPTFNKLKGYAISGFRAGSYGAEFLIFNSTDTSLNLDSTSGNYLRIQGVTFTQESEHNYSVDEYFSQNSDFSNPKFNNNLLIKSPLIFNKQYDDIKASRMTYGKKDFYIDAPYIQTQDDAQEVMSWVISKIMKPRKSVGVQTFGTPHLQLGDIVEIDYKDSSETNEISAKDSRFVVYNIEYIRNTNGPETRVYLSEVV